MEQQAEKDRKMHHIVRTKVAYLDKKGGIMPKNVQK